MGQINLFGAQRVLAVFALAWLAIAFALIAGGPAKAQPSLPDYVIAEYGTPPEWTDAPLPQDIQDAIEIVFVDSLERSEWGNRESRALEVIRAHGDPRVAWLITDMMRFTWRETFDDALANTAAELLGIELETPQRWHELTDHLIAWDVPSYPGYLDQKRAIFTRFLDGWDDIFREGDIDWRMVSWGGVMIDQSAL